MTVLIDDPKLASGPRRPVVGGIAGAGVGANAGDRTFGAMDGASGRDTVAARPTTGGISGIIGTAISNLNGGSVDAALANLTQQGWKDIKSRIIPLENDLIARSMGDGEVAADRAGDLARSGGLRAAETFGRNLRRSGTSLTAEEQSAMSRRRSLSTALDAGGAEDSSRRLHRERSTEMLGSLVGLGRQVHNTAVGGLNASADAQSARENAGRAARQSAISTGIGAIGLLAAFI